MIFIWAVLPQFRSLLPRNHRVLTVPRLQRFELLVDFSCGAVLLDCSFQLGVVIVGVALSFDGELIEDLARPAVLTVLSRR